MLVILFEKFFIVFATFWNTEDYEGAYLTVLSLAQMI
jgi:hypothetical protein